MLTVVGLAALSITILHLQGKSLLHAILATPLPSFWLEGLQDPEPLSDKTEVYTASLAEEARRRTFPVASPFGSDQYQPTYRDTTIVETSILDTAQKVSVAKKALKRRSQTSQEKIRKDSVAIQPIPTPSLLFQSVRAEPPALQARFISCVIHGDQQVTNQTRLVLRLSEPTRVGGKEIPAGTLLYGLALFSQNRLQIQVSQIGPITAPYQVYDHTYQPGIWLDRNNDRSPVVTATQQFLLREGQRQVSRLPLPLIPQMGRGLMQRRRRHTSVFLPDGFPLFLYPQNP